MANNFLCGIPNGKILDPPLAGSEGPGIVVKHRTCASTRGCCFLRHQSSHRDHRDLEVGFEFDYIVHVPLGR